MRRDRRRERDRRHVRNVARDDGSSGHRDVLEHQRVVLREDVRRSRGHARQKQPGGRGAEDVVRSGPERDEVRREEIRLGHGVQAVERRARDVPQYQRREADGRAAAVRVAMGQGHEVANVGSGDAQVVVGTRELRVERRAHLRDRADRDRAAREHGAEARSTDERVRQRELLDEGLLEVALVERVREDRRERSQLVSLNQAAPLDARREAVAERDVVRELGRKRRGGQGQDRGGRTEGTQHFLHGFLRLKVSDGARPSRRGRSPCRCRNSCRSAESGEGWRAP